MTIGSSHNNEHAPPMETGSARLGEYRCDDAPPYFTILVVGHLVVPGALAVEQSGAPSLALQLGIWIPVTLILTLCLLPFIKGGVLGLQWAMGIRG
mgnify:CR=1 FL=1